MFNIYSQRDPAWCNNELGFSNTTIGGYGCTITSLGMFAGLTPADVNERLRGVDGYAAPQGNPSQKNLIIWSKIQEAIPGFEFEQRYYEYNNDQVKQAISDNGACLVEVDWDGSPKTTGRHWVLFIGGGKLLDPWTGTERPTSTYGLLTGFSVIKRIAMSLNGGDVFKVPGGDAIWKLENGSKRVYSCPEAFVEDGKNWDAVINVDEATRDSMPNGEPIVSRYEKVLASLGRGSIEKIFIDGDALSPNQILLVARKLMDELNAQVDSLKKEKIQLDSDNRKLKQDKELLKTDNTKLAASVKALNTDVARKAKEIKKLNDEVMACKDNYNKLDLKWQDEVSRAKETLTQLNQSNNKLTVDLETTRKLLDDANDTIKDQINQIRELKLAADFSTSGDVYRQLWGPIYIKTKRA